jgi:DNA invertase Pin-like site-specific DNA recombinase
MTSHQDVKLGGPSMYRFVPTEKQAARIKACFEEEGMTKKAIAKRFGCGVPMIVRILKEGK